MGNKQTAVEWLIQQINGDSHSIGLPYGMNIRIDIPKEIIEQAKEMERQQIMDAVNATMIDDDLNAFEYFTETYE